MLLYSVNSARPGRATRSYARLCRGPGSSLWPGVRVAIGLVLLAGTGWAESSQGLSYNRDVRPILADNCFQCHGPDKGTREAGLRIDVREAALLGVEGRAAIVPGKPEESEMFRRITAEDPAERMPPEAIGKTVEPDQVETIRKWIEEGAEYEPHWAYVPPERADPPAVERDDWVRNPVDAFVLARLEDEGVEPMPEADPHTLVRRLSFDLRGLPPTPAEVDAFVNDTSPDAYERMVERFLASPHYGERMAVYWLDLVRFADTVGYHGDQATHVSPYRDYVIDAFNDNLPFDRFTREQLAGDLLPDPTLDQRIATAYNRLNMMTREGGAQAKEYLAKYASDRVRTTSTVWMGSTVGCAECHDHKFDPFTAKDFYSFAAFFADIDEQGVYTDGDRDYFPPKLLLPDDDETEILDGFDRELAAIEKSARPANVLLDRIRDGTIAPPEAEKAVAAYEAMDHDSWSRAYRDWLAARARVVRGEEAMEIQLVTGASGGGAESLENWNVERKEGRKARRQNGAGFARHAADGFHPPRSLQRRDRIYTWVYLDPEEPPAGLMLELISDDGKHRVRWGDDSVLAEASEDGSEAERAGDLPDAGGWVRLEVTASDIGLNHRTPVRGIAFGQLDGRAWWGSAGFLGNPRGISGPVSDILEKDPADRDEEQERALLAHYFESTQLWETSRRKAAVAHRKEAFEKSVLSVVTTEAVEPREIRILPRGDWMDDSGEVVEPAVPHFLPQPENGEERRLNRLDLADWLVDPENPLTARTMVNRFWRLFYGVGLSRALDELGNRGEWPEHRRLLDWLSLEFIDSGWDVKHIVRLLVTSSAYRVSSQAPDKLRRVDPDNRLHARQARERLAAEFIRDNALAISGLLVPKVGGPSVMPYQPEGYYAELNFPKREYVPSTGEDQYRRGVYTHWQRTFLHPSLMAFDAPSRDECVAERPYSNTPLQALALLNDPTYVEAARAFAARILTESNGDSDAERVAWAWRQAVSRNPNERERETLLGLLEGAREEYRGDPEAAESLGAVGLYTWPSELDVSELAAWTAVTRTILNLQETFVRY